MIKLILAISLLTGIVQQDLLAKDKDSKNKTSKPAPPENVRNGGRSGSYNEPGTNGITLDGNSSHGSSGGFSSSIPGDTSPGGAWGAFKKKEKKQPNSGGKGKIGQARPGNVSGGSTPHYGGNSGNSAVNWDTGYVGPGSTSHGGGTIGYRDSVMLNESSEPAPEGFHEGSEPHGERESIPSSIDHGGRDNGLTNPSSGNDYIPSYDGGFGGTDSGGPMFKTLADKLNKQIEQLKSVFCQQQYLPTY